MIYPRKKLRILIADDHALIRHGIKNIIKSDDSHEVIGEVTDGEELLAFLEKIEVDMIILDISMPKISGMELIETGKNKYPWMKILMLTMHKEKEYFYNAMAAGANGYLMKDDSEEELPLAIEKIRSCKKYISPHLADDFAEDVIGMYRHEKRSPFRKLTKREKEILQLLVKGYTSRKMAEHLHLSQRTVDHHRSNLLRKFGRKNSVDLVNYAVRNGLVASD